MARSISGKPNKNNNNKIWDGITDTDFINEKNLDIVDIVEYNKEKMELYVANTNLWRHLIRLSDSLKPVERRILYNLYLSKAYPGTKMKSSTIAGNTMIYHGHGDKGIYDVMVGMAQSWKKQCPFILGKGNFGNVARPEMYASARYTEASMTKYAKECFFDDYDDDCVEVVFNTACDKNEPMSFPAKFPNVLVNGGMGIAFGNSFRIPPYNINDIITVCKNMVKNPDTASVHMIPDLPCGCEIIDDGISFEDIINTGKGVLKMRATTQILDRGRYWVIKVLNLPWMVSLTSVEAKIVELTKAGALPIRETEDHCTPVMGKNGLETEIDYRIIFDKAHDPQTILNKLYSLTELQKTVSVDFKVVLDNLTVARLSMRQLIQSWLDERRSYKRRLFNKKLNKMTARVDLLEVLLFLLKSDNIEKTIRIVKDSEDDELVDRLLKHGRGKMNSYQASKIGDMNIRAFNKSNKRRYQNEIIKLKEEIEILMDLISSEDKIDKIIIDELEELRKYGSPRKSKIISESTKKYISDTNHSIIVSKDNYLKKLNFSNTNPNKNYIMGTFRTNDYPLHHLIGHNTSLLCLYDNFGRYSAIPLHEIDNTEPSNIGHKVFDIAKLNGRIVSVSTLLDQDTIDVAKRSVGIPYLVSITERGYSKKTPLEEFTKIKNTKNIRAMKIRDDDALVVAETLFNNTTILIYSKKGIYTILKVSNIGEQAKDSMGLITLRLDDDDAVAGICVIGKDDTHLVIVSDKGVCKKVDLRYFGEPSKRGSKKDQGSMITLDTNDNVREVIGVEEKSSLNVIMRNNSTIVDVEDIPSLTKKAKGKRIIFGSSNSNIIRVEAFDDPNRKNRRNSKK